jgi:hypothetical protein
MSNLSYNLSDAYVAPNAAGSMQSTFDGVAHRYVGMHASMAFAVIIALGIVVVWLLLWRCKEHFNPTQNLRDQDSDQFGFARKEHLEGDRSTSAFAQQVQSSGGGAFTLDPKAAPGAPGSMAWQVLHSADFDCANRKEATDDAWMWMNGVAHESMEGGRQKPSTDNDFSRIITGN